MIGIELFTFGIYLAWRGCDAWRRRSKSLFCWKRLKLHRGILASSGFSQWHLRRCSAHKDVETNPLHFYMQVPRLKDIKVGAVVDVAEEEAAFGKRIQMIFRRDRLQDGEHLQKIHHTWRYVDYWGNNHSHPVNVKRSPQGFEYLGRRGKDESVHRYLRRLYSLIFLGVRSNFRTPLACFSNDDSDGYLQGIRRWHKIRRKNE